MSESFIVKRNDKVGRYCVAGRDFKRAEEVLGELPLVVGPKTCSPPVCLGCYRVVDGSSLCPNCRWPVCGREECWREEWHRGECEVWRSAGAAWECRGCGGGGGGCPQYECVTPLRLLLAAEAAGGGPGSGGPPRLALPPLQSHSSDRARNAPLHHAEEVNVVRYLTTACKLAHRFSEETIHRVCGMLEVNSFEIITEEGWPLRGVYPTLALLSHSCVANTAHTVLPRQGFRMVLRTTVEVKEGDELFSSYVGCLEPTLVRREVLRECKYFDCECGRCADPSELSTEMSSLLCPGCRSPRLLSTRPLDEEAEWKCMSCGFTKTGEEIKKLYSDIRDAVVAVDKLPFGPEKLQAAERVLEESDGSLGPWHGLRSGLWYALSQLYGRVGGVDLDHLPDHLLRRKILLSARLLTLLDVVEPGSTRIRGLTLYEREVGETVLRKREWERGEVGAEEYRSGAESSAAALQEALDILLLEPQGTLEAALARASAATLHRLRSSLASL